MHQRPEANAGADHATSGAVIRLLYALVFLFLGAYGNYFPLWLRDVGWSEDAIGWVSSMRSLALIGFPLAWGFLADRWGRPVVVLRMITFAAAVAFVPIALSPALVVVLPTMLVFSAFRVGTIPATDALTIRHVERVGGDYGRYRIWGSGGFIIGGFLLGFIVEATGREAIPPTLIAMLALTAGAVLLLRDAPLAHVDRSPLRPTLARLLADPRLRGFLLVTFVNRLGAQGVLFFLPLHLDELGVGDAWLPAFWSVGVVSEIVLMRNAPRLFGRFHPAQLIRWCIALAALQAALTAAVTTPVVLLPVMLLHGMTFGIWYYSSVTWLGRHVPDVDRTTAQGLFQSVGFGLGGTLSALAAGYLFEAGHGPLLFSVAAVVQLAAWGLARWRFTPC